MPKLLRHRSAALSISMTSFILNSSARRNLRSTVSARSSSRTSGTPQMSSSFGSASSSDAVGTKVSSMASTVHPWAPLSWAPRSSPPFRRRPCSPAAAASRRGVFSVGVTLAGSASPCHSTASSRTTTMDSVHGDCSFICCVLQGLPGGAGYTVMVLWSNKDQSTHGLLRCTQ
ncbi:hypothetical protein BRADI_3g35617v3 [Brachypodium distachyon]|uniref:Uncharacterized protein n=1 Tax=Brachypodium distachyon TaxID=15368 RepID=A0A2K2D1A9_BRADI|nr:hypothetical protein BRADI_3g35617v3 [Brachypodium distachyon]